MKLPEVYFFGTCLIDLFFPEAGISAIKLIQREGISVIYPRQQTCCGQAAYNSGYWEEALNVALKQVELFPKSIPVVVPSGSCASMMKNNYPQLFKGHKKYGQVKELSGRVVELTQFLVNDLGIKLSDFGDPVTVTWHSSCHALREMNIKEEPQNLLAQLKNVKIEPLNREYECCGFGGTFAVNYPELSSAMMRDKIADIINTGASVVLSGDGGCLLNIDGGMRKQQKAIKAKHIASFLWERTNEKA